VTVAILNYFHRKGFRRFLAAVIGQVYKLKGYKGVITAYHPPFRAYEYVVGGTSFMSLGPGWAYSFDYLKQALVETYCHSYLPQPGDCIVDIGAGLGEETVICASLVGPTGRVHALEANPVTFAGLKYLCERNRFNWVTPHNLAIYNADGEVTIEDDEENYLVNTIGTSNQSKNSFTVQARTLDTLVKENGITCIDFLKSNIEGAEQFLIEGMKDSIHLIKNLCISCHDFRHVYHNHGEFYMTKDKVSAFLKAHGFEIEVRHTGNRVVDDFIYARRKS
jgi:FkbM family methyltransferase